MNPGCAYNIFTNLKLLSVLLNSKMKMKIEILLCLALVMYYRQLPSFLLECCTVFKVIRHTRKDVIDNYLIASEFTIMGIEKFLCFMYYRQLSDIECCTF